MKSFIYHKPQSRFYRDKSLNNAYLSGDESLPLIRFSCYKDFSFMDAFVTTREGGVSKDHLASLNLGLGRGDSDENIIENYKRVANSIGIPIENIVKTDQVHSDKIAYVDESILPCGPLVQKYEETDGLYTNVSSLALCTSVADCVPVFLADPVTETIACVHSGWRGTVLKIGQKAVGLMENMGADAKDIVALIGPSICQDNYEVTADVVDEFKKCFDPAQIKDIAYQTDEIHYRLDLWAACYFYLIQAGLVPQNIHFGGICTYENHNLLFSHRYTNGMRGNLNGIIFKRP